MKIESVISLLAKNKRLMSMAVKKLTAIVSEKMGEADTVKISNQGESRVVLATANGKFWNIEPSKFFDIGDAIGFGIKLDIMKVLSSKAEAMRGVSVFLCRNDGQIDIILTDQNGEVFSSGSIEEMMQNGVYNTTESEISEISALL